MADINVDSSVVPTATGVGSTAPTSKPNGGSGPKYNEDANLLDGTSEDTSKDSDEIVEEIETSKTEKEDEDSDKDASDEEDLDATASEEETEKPKIPFDRPTVSEIKAKFPDFFKPSFFGNLTKY